MFVTAKSDIGLIRDENQDNFKVGLIGEDTAVCVVCDGMGGALAGGDASSIASNVVFDRLKLSQRSQLKSYSEYVGHCIKNSQHNGLRKV